MLYHRQINILKTKSFFLFGARSTGKTTVLREQFKGECGLWIDLLKSSDFLAYSRNPELLYKQALSLPEEKPWVVIDEVQRVPKLLNEVHRVLESPESSQTVRFALTGSSARKLKRGAANLLGGRALLNHIFPLTSIELGDDFDIQQVLNWGALPSIASESDSLTKEEMLQSYYATYLREEISEEQIVRQLDPFTRFLEVAAQASGKIVNYAGVARDSQVDPKSVARYFQILEDTLLGIFLPSFHSSVRKQQSKSPKFYIFDLGVQRALRGVLNVPITPQSYGYGNVFEQFIILEIYRLNAYCRTRYKLFYLRTKDDAEIDLIVEKPGERMVILIEIKSSTFVNSSDARHLRAFQSDFRGAESWLISQDEKERTEDGVRVMHWRTALYELFGSERRGTPKI